ncbi:sulfurtransferase complex subunit TusB [Halomonas sp. PAMB 3264]|uniref:sulfurtransferase complex subunit TusB n=1 Tax=Halomonas sp. PAMB 3264 TaxID=3075222 RepID=UPI0028A0EA7A|nr:sulfurtransferase complex subunit TusB [Halomonas sp. PAMB 3264]WNL43813.1 sulfurtransferase complex subunit TusB [Halomonas sp. PAMB 3264]
MLHILNQRVDANCATNMLRVVAKSDEVVLIEKAVQACLKPEWTGFEQCKGRVYLLQEDLASRGLFDVAKRQAVSIVDMAGFLALSERHEQCVTWY